MGSDGSSSPEPGTGTVERGQERFGPLAMRRYEKEDGRVLILFDRAEEPPADGAHGETPDRGG